MTPSSKKCLATFLSADELRAATFVRHVEFYESLDSTNDRAAMLARDPALELPALVVARHQTAGRGRGANQWWSADGALTFSLLIDPASHGVATAHWPQLSLTTAVAICDALQRECGEDGSNSGNPNPTPGSSLPACCSVKWPNDVFLNGRKIAGILLESPGGSHPSSSRLIIGIGININNSFHSTPTDTPALVPSNKLSQHAIALCDVTGFFHNLQHVLVTVLRALNGRIAQLAAHAPQLPSAWQQLSFLTDQIITVTSGGQTITGRCLGIARDGALALETPHGPQCFHSGSVRLA